MGPTFTIRPVEDHRQRHVVRATVIDYVNHQTGRLWRKRNFPSLKIRFSDEAYQTIAQILERISRSGGITITPPNREVVIGYKTTVERDSYKIGEEIEVHFSTADGLHALFTGAYPFRWDGASKITTKIA